MRSLSKVLGAIGIIAAVAVAASAADARSRHASPPAYDSVRTNSVSIPYDAGGPAYGVGQRGLNTSSDFQLQGR